MKKQLTFDFLSNIKLIHGGEHSIKKRKTARPLKTNKPIHLVLRANRGGLRAKKSKIQTIIKTYADQFNIKVYKSSINTNHIHLILRTPRRLNFQSFLRSITGLIARTMGKGKLWLHLAFSRIANWGREFKVLVSYVIQNQQEASGVISYKPRSG